MELRQAEHFVAVVDCGSVTRAAAFLHLSQPSLSQSIRAFERQFGATLFERVGRRLVPSDEGWALLPQARRLLADAAEARAAVHEVATLNAGALTIAVHAELIVDPLAPLAGRFRRTHPDVVLNLVDPGSNSTAIRLVQSGECDAAVTTVAATGAPLTSVRLCVQTLSLAAAADFPLPAGDPLALADLAAVPLVLTPPTTSGRELVESAFAGAGVRPTAMVECAPREAIWALTLGGAGASFFLPAMADAARAQGVQVRSTDPSITREVFLVTRSGPGSSALEHFLRLVSAPGPSTPAR